MDYFFFLVKKTAQKMMSKFIIPVALFYMIGVKAQAPNGSSKLQQEIFRVPLQKELIADSTAMKPGMGNLFFSNEFAANEIKIPAQWKNAEVAAIIEHDSLLASVFIARYKDETGVYRYFADKNGDGDISDEKELVFTAGTQDLSVADVFLTVKSKNRTVSDRMIHYQIINPVDAKEKDKYVYALLKEYRAGTLQIGNFSSKIELYSFFRRPYFQREGIGTTFFIDLNGDGTINKKASYINQDGVPVRSERMLDPRSPIRINGIILKLKKLDTEGNWIEFEKQDMNTGFGEGFVLPPENTKYKSLSEPEAEKKLVPDPGGLTLLILSSKTCIPCEQIRPALNKLNDEFTPRGLNSFIMLRENDPAEVADYLSKHEYKAKALISDKEGWSKLNSETIVPMFYLINSSGEIVYKDIGAGADKEYFLRWYIKKSLKID